MERGALQCSSDERYHGEQHEGGQHPEGEGEQQFDGHRAGGPFELPSTLQATNTALTKAGGMAKELGPTLQALRPGARALGPSLAATRPFLQESTPNRCRRAGCSRTSR